MAQTRRYRKLPEPPKSSSASKLTVVAGPQKCLPAGSAALAANLGLRQAATDWARRSKAAGRLFAMVKLAGE